MSRPTTTVSRLLAVLGLVALGLVGPLPFAGSPASAAGAPCEGRAGVTVVVDFGPLPGGTEQACVPGAAGDNAAQVTSDGGFRIDFTNDGQPFVCRIAGQPEPDRESCNRTPPDDAYWGLFWSDGTSGWKYSNYGATSLEVKDGWSIGWRFQNGDPLDQPSAGPRRNAEPSPSPSSTPRPSASSTPRPSATSATSGPSTAAGSATASAPVPATPTRTPSPSRTASSSATADPTEASSSPTDSSSDATDTTDSTDSAGAPEDGSFATVDPDRDDSGPGNDTGIAAVAGLGGLALLAGSAAVVAYRRGRP